jgi:hypothetical protein
LSEEQKLWVFEKRVLRRIFRPKREEERSWKKLHNIFLTEYRYGDQIKEDEVDRRCGMQ